MRRRPRQRGVGQLFVVSQVLVQGRGGDPRVTCTELAHKQLVRIAAPVVLAGVRGNDFVHTDVIPALPATD